MKRIRVILAITCLILPGLATFVWFYSGTPQIKTIQMPDFPTIDLPKAPISTPIPLAKPPSIPITTVLFDMNHGNMVSMTEIDPLVRLIESKGGAIQVTAQETYLADALKSVNAYVCLAPIQAFFNTDREALTAFVKRGGKLLIAADPTRNQMIMTDAAAIPNISSVDAVNQILEPFDISISDDYLYDMVTNEGNYRNVIFDDFKKETLTEGVKRLVIYGGHSVHSVGNPLTVSLKTTFSSNTDQAGEISPFAFSQSGDGSVLALGDISLLTSQYYQSADNQIFVQNIASFLVDEKREKTLVDFPHILDGVIAIQPIGILKVDGLLISGISSLERAMNIPTGSLTISEKPNQSINRIVLSTFKPADENKDVIESLKINLLPTPRATETLEPSPTQSITATPFTELNGDGYNSQYPLENFSDPIGSGSADKSIDIEIPGMGRLNTNNLGLVGLIREEKRTTLVIMASSSESLKTFMDQISMGGLNGCLVQDNLAVCNTTGGMMGNPVQPKG